MKKLLLVLLMLPFVAHSQTITVQDQQTLEPVPFANISGPNSTGVVTDINGKADITQWADTTELRISFLGYETRKVWKYEIKDKNVIQKIVLCDVQKEVYPEIEKALLNLLHTSGYPGVQFLKKVDFEELYKKNFN